MRKAFLQTSKIVGSISSLGKKDSPYRTSYWKHATVLCGMLALVLGNVLPLSAEEPHTPITIDLAISHAPRFGESATVTVTVKSTENAPGTLVEVILPAGATAKTSRWTVDLGANVPVTLKTDIVIRGSGNLSLSARALKQWGKTTAWGQMKTIPLH